jgi:hypothetical protein
VIAGDHSRWLPDMLTVVLLVSKVKVAIGQMAIRVCLQKQKKIEDRRITYAHMWQGITYFINSSDLQNT